jgi:hypothetical protein
VPCRRQGGHGGNFVGVHADRDRAAMTAGLLAKCPAGPGARADEDQMDLL